MNTKHYRPNPNSFKRAPGMSRMGRIRPVASAKRQTVQASQALENVSLNFKRWLSRARQAVSTVPRTSTAKRIKETIKASSPNFNPTIGADTLQEQRRIFMSGSEYLPLIALGLVIVGALNWALVGLLDFNLVAYLFGPYTPLTRMVYSLVGIAGLYMAYSYDRFNV